MTDTISLFATAASPVLQAGLIAAAGAGMAWQGALDSRGCSVIAALCFYVFTPALTFSTLAAAISFNSIRHLWPLLVNMTISSLLGLAIGQLTATILRTPVKFRKLIVVAIAFGNVGNLPLVFVGALCSDTTAIFQKALGKDCVSLGIAYTAFDICVATLFQFTLAIYLLKPQRIPAHLDRIEIIDGGSAEYQELIIENQLDDEDRTRLFPSNVSSSPPHYREITTNNYTPNLSVEQEQERRRYDDAEQMHPRPGSNGRLHKHPTVSDLLHPETNTINTLNTPSSPSNRRTTTGGSGFEIDVPSTSSTYSNFKSKLKEWVSTIDLKSAFPVPTQAAFGGVFIGCIPPLKHLFYGVPNPPLRVIASALELLGQGLIPGAIPLLGAVLYRGPGKSQLPPRITVGVVLVRLVLQPVLLTGMVVLALKLKLFVAPDPMFLLTLLLANATPTAINMQTLTVLYKFGAEEMSQMLFFEYIFSLVTLPMFAWLFLRIIDIYVEAPSPLLDAGTLP